MDNECSTEVESMIIFHYDRTSPSLIQDNPDEKSDGTSIWALFATESFTSSSILDVDVYCYLLNYKDRHSLCFH